MARHPSFEEGRRAFKEGILANPYRSIVRGKYQLNSIAAKEFEAGWNYEYFVNL